MNTSDFSLLIGLLLRVVGLGILFVYVLPKAYREMRIRDALIFFRYLIFIGIFLFAGLSMFISLVNLGRLLDFFDDSVVYILSLVAGTTSVLISIVLALMYSREYKDK